MHCPGVDVSVYPGGVVGQIGPSGLGKTTLLKCLGASSSGWRLRAGAIIVVTHDEQIIPTFERIYPSAMARPMKKRAKG